MTELKYKDITEKIIGASFEVHKFPGNGFQGLYINGRLARILNYLKAYRLEVGC